MVETRLVEKAVHSTALYGLLCPIHGNTDQSIQQGENPDAKPHTGRLPGPHRTEKILQSPPKKRESERCSNVGNPFNRELGASRAPEAKSRDPHPRVRI